MTNQSTENPYTQVASTFCLALGVSYLLCLLVPIAIPDKVVAGLIVLLWLGFAPYIGRQLVRIRAIHIDPRPVGIRPVVEYFRGVYSLQRIRRRASGAALLFLGVTHVGLTILFIVGMYQFPPSDADTIPYLGAQLLMSPITVSVTLAYCNSRVHTRQAREQLADAESHLSATLERGNGGDELDPADEVRSGGSVQ